MSQHSKWLVRSGGRIIGPFEGHQIPQLLKSREVGLRDEVSAPFARWQTLEFHPEFSEEVDQFKRDLLNEKTEVSLTPTSSGLTQTSTDLVDSELTEEITQDISGFTRTREIVVEGVEDVSSSKNSNLEAAQYQLKGLGTTSPYVSGRSKRASYLIQVSVVICALLIGGFLFFRMQSQRPEVEKLSTSQLRSVVLKLIERGEYKEALHLMKSRQEDASFNTSLGIYFSLLSLQEEGQSLSARRVLEYLLETQPDMKVRTLTGLGLSYMVDQNYGEASEYFKMALSLDQHFVPAQVDVFIANALGKKKVNFAQSLSQSRVTEQPEGLITAGLEVIRENKSDVFSLALKKLEVFSASALDYKIEAQFLVEYLKWRLNPSQIDFSSWVQLVDSDPQLTEDHRQNVFIYRHHLSWANFLPLCKQMVSRRDNEEAQLLNVFCHYKAGQFVQARTLSEAAVDRNPKNALIQSWYAMSLKESGSADQASVVLGRALEGNRRSEYRLPLLLQGRFCEDSKNWDCAYSSWKKLLEMDYNNLAALAGLAKISDIRNTREEGERFLKRGISISPDYKPFLALKDEWRSQL